MARDPELQSQAGLALVNDQEAELNLPRRRRPPTYAGQFMYLDEQLLGSRWLQAKTLFGP